MSPFFIIASPRSGSTLLRLMLSCHRDLCVPQEAGFLVTLHKKYRNYSGAENELDLFLNDLIDSEKFENWRLDRVQVKEGIDKRSPVNYPALINAVYQTYIDVWQPGKSIWGDKNNFFLRKIELINELFPDAKFIHLVRDGRDVACSYRGLSKVRSEHSPKFSANLSEAALAWKNNVSLISQSFSKLDKGSVIVVRYEELVENTEKVLGEICEFLQVDYDPKMLNYYAAEYAHHYEPSSFDKWKKLNKSGVTQSQVGRWQREMFGENIFLYQKMAGKWLEHYGYDLQATNFSLSRLFKNYLKAKLK